MTKPLRLSGNWCGVCQDGLARKVGDQLVLSRLETPNTPWWVKQVGSIRWVDCASHETTRDVQVVFTKSSGNADHAYIARESGPVELIAQKTLAVILRRRHGKWLALVAHKDSSWKVINTETMVVENDGRDPNWSTRGLLDMTPDLRPIWDAPRNDVFVGAVKFQSPRRSGLWTVAQGSRPSTLLVAHGQTVGVLLNGEAREVKVAELPNGHAAICSRVEQGYGVAFAMLSPADVRSLPKPGGTQPPPTNPPDEDEDMTDAQVKDLFARLARIERGIADQQEDVNEVKANVLKLVTQRPPSEPPTEPPVEPGQPVIDPKQVEWLDEDVSDWAETSQITDVTISQGPRADQGKVRFPHTKAGQWPVFNDDGHEGEGNVWVFGNVGGKWYGATAEWLEPGQVEKRFTAQVGPPAEDNWGIGPHTKHEPLESWSPRSGEWIGIMVSTPARNATRTSNERSQIFLTRWP